MVIIPASQRLPYKIELFDLKGDLPPHVHRIQSHTLTVLEGVLDVYTKTPEGIESNITLSPLKSLEVGPNVIHSLKAVGGWVRFQSIASPPLEYPDDVYEPDGAARS